MSSRCCAATRPRAAVRSRVVTVRAGKSYADGMEERLAQIRQNRIDKFNQKKALREAVSSLLPALAKIACMRERATELS